jgi:hypothetical protein
MACVKVCYDVYKVLTNYLFLYGSVWLDGAIGFVILLGHKA